MSTATFEVNELQTNAPTDAQNRPTTKQTLQDLNDNSPTPPQSTGDGIQMSQRQINRLHELYRKGEVDPEIFAIQMATWLGHWVQDDPYHQIAYSFLVEVADWLAEGKFANYSFGRMIQRQFIDHCRNFHPDHLIESEDDYSDRYATAKKLEREDALTRAYERYVEDPSLAEGELFKALRSFILPKIGWSMRDFPEISEDADDRTQEAIRSIFKALPKYNGGVAKFVNWINKIVYNARVDAFNAAKKESGLKAPLFVDGVDEEGKPCLEENPIILQEALRKRNWIASLGPDPMRLLTWVDGVEYQICLELLEGRTMKDIAKAMRMTQEAVRKRVQRMREKRKKIFQQGLKDRKAALAAPRSGRPYSDWTSDYEQAVTWVRPDR